MSNEPIIIEQIQLSEVSESLPIIDSNHVESTKDKENQKILLDGLSKYLVGELKDTSKEKKKSTEERIETSRNWHISLRFKENTFRDGLDPYSVINYLNKDGEIKNLKTILVNLPRFDKLNPESCYLGFEILYSSKKDASFILQAFEFVEFNCDIRIISPDKTSEELKDFFSSFQENKFKLAKTLLSMNSITRNDLKKLKTKTYYQPEIKIEEKIHSTNTAPKQTPIENNSTSAKPISIEKKSTHKESKTIRVESSKLDTLINLVGELVTAGANLNQVAFKRKDSNLSEVSYYLNHLISEIRESSLKIRMVQIGEVFSKFQRTVRDIGLELNKEIQLVITGAETELDKTIIERINDPLVHLIRNAIDHGIESPDEREKKGKSRIGQLFLNAYHETGTIVIEVIDDGKGLDTEKILNKAIEKGLVASDKNLSEQEIFKLIFKAGFSTADKVSNISGRGVGLDVVEKSIESLRGSVILSSEKDKGSKFKVKLPLTLAIIDGFLFQVGNHYYIIPLSQVIECIEFSADNIEKNGNKDFLNLRGEVLPFLKLGSFFHILENDNVRKNILVVQYGLSKVGLLIDNLHGEIQTVIKPLGKIFMNLKGISGSTVLGSGEVALILDLSTLLKKAEDFESNLNKRQI